MIRLYALNINEIPDYINEEKIFDILPEYRKNKINRMRFEKDKKLSFGAGILTKYVLLKNGLNDSNITFVNKDKPVIEGMYFNVSHSEEYIICSTSDMNVGCDIEKIGEYNDKIAKRFFSKSEYDYLSGIIEANKAREFYRLWTMKESYIKMTGEGISVGLDTFFVKFANNVQIHRKIDRAESCQIFEYDLSGYCCSVCGEENMFDKNIQHLKYYELCDTIMKLENI